MAFAIFYNQSDLAAMVNALQGADLTGPDIADGAQWVTSGLTDYLTAQDAPGTRQDSEAKDSTKVIVLNRPGKDLIAFIAFIQKLCDIYGSVYMCAIADDLFRSSGAVDPWP